MRPSRCWDREVEEEVTNIIITASAQITVSFTNAGSTAVDPGRVVVLNEDYDLAVDGDEYEGQAEFTIVNTNGEWRMFSWKDRRRSGSQLSTWGFLKGPDPPRSLGSLSVTSVDVQRARPCAVLHSDTISVGLVTLERHGPL